MNDKGTFLPEAMVNRRVVACIITMGVIVRLGLGFCLGTQDMEWWKIWGKDSVERGLGQMFAPDDGTLVQELREGASPGDVYRRLGRQIPANGYPVRYERRLFPVVQPPVYLFSLSAATHLYALVRADIPNTRGFNFAINGITLVAALGITWSMWRAILPIAGRDAAILASVYLFFLNPIVILNGPIQGYLDQLAALFVILAIVSLLEGRVVKTWIFLAVAVLSKPQAVLVAPLILVACLVVRPSLRSNAAGWLSACTTAALLCLPWLRSGRFLSMILGVAHVAQFPDAIVVEALNAWWPFNYALGAQEQARECGALAPAFFGPGIEKLESHSQQDLAAWFGFNTAPLSWILFGTCTILILLLWFPKRHDRPRGIECFAAGMIIFSYFLFAKSVHTNHYFLMIPCFAFYVGIHPRLLGWFFLVVFSFLLQDLLFYGFGRDLNNLRWRLDRHGLLWITNLISAFNVALFCRGLLHLRGEHGISRQRAPLPPSFPKSP